MQPSYLWALSHSVQQVLYKKKREREGEKKPSQLCTEGPDFGDATGLYFYTSCQLFPFTEGAGAREASVFDFLLLSSPPPSAAAAQLAFRH